MAKVYRVIWREIVTYQKDIEADHKDEAFDVANENIAWTDEIDTSFHDIVEITELETNRGRKLGIIRKESEMQQ